jgi:ABC-type transporter MlaC component
MTRKEHIFEYLKERGIPITSLEANSIIEGIEWADEHPDSKRTYTKQQLIDMGFAFTTNGDIVTPNQLNEDLKKYLKHQKQKFIKKGKEWISQSYTSGVLDWKNCDSIIERFCKAMEK